MKKYFEDLTHILYNSLMSVDESAFERLVKDSTAVLKNGGKIIVTGLGKNVPVCEKFVGMLNSFGLRSAFINTNSANHGDIGVVDERDLVIMLTKSGETIESVLLYSYLEDRGCELWLLSFNKNSTLSKRMKNTLIMDLEHEGDAWNIVPNNSTTLNLIVLQCLAVRLAETMGVGLDTFKRNHPGGHIGEVLKNEWAK
jgi:arabinose-5-phosphate isomerase